MGCPLRRIPIRIVDRPARPRALTGPLAANVPTLVDALPRARRLTGPLPLPPTQVPTQVDLVPAPVPRLRTLPRARPVPIPPPPATSIGAEGGPRKVSDFVREELRSRVIFGKR